MESNINSVSWFEIPVENMERAVKFYETVFGVKLQREKMGPLDMAWFPWIDTAPGSGGSLVYAPEYYRPSDNGTLVYFNALSGDLKTELARVKGAGGKVLQEKTLITEDIGYMALLLDTEGNRIALHSRK
jgi:predicted enzyme related to lactoylglutathione lyase